MINPHFTNPGYTRMMAMHGLILQGGKVYRATFALPGRVMWCRHAFQRASEAEDHAKSLHARWCRLYDAAQKGAM